MRLIRLRVRNIASLKGEHTVYFAGIQEHSPLFAITGETGSGKSTILNSIGLALYGKVYKTNVNQTDVVTLGEKEGQIELIFQVAQKYYIADWRAKVRKQNGELLKAPQTQRVVHLLEGEDFNSTRQEVVESVDKLLNLDFDQFCKCIILNQGEFARFLMSPFTERKEILEKLYPGEMLDSLSRELKSELDTEIKAMQEVETQLLTMKGENSSGDDLKIEKQKLSSEAAHSESWLKKIEGVAYHFTSLMSYREKYLENKKKSETIKSDLSLATTKYNHALKESQRLTEIYLAHKEKQEKELPRLQELLKEEETLRHMEVSSGEIQKKVTECSTKIQKLQLELTIKEDEHKLWQKSHETLKEKIHFPIEDLKTHISNIEALFDLQTVLETKEKEKEVNEIRLKELEVQGKEIAGVLSNVHKQLEGIPESIGQTLAQLKKQKEDFQKLLEERQKSELKAADLTKQITEQKAELTHSQKKSEALIHSLGQGQQELHSLEASLKLIELRGAIETCLVHASAEKPDACPVCHSEVRPEAWQSLLNSLNKTDTEAMKKRANELSHFIISVNEESKLLLSLQKNLEESIRLKTQELDTLNEKLKTPLEDRKSLEEEIGVCEKKIWEQESLKKEAEKLQGDLKKARGAYTESRNALTQITTLLTSQEEAKNALLLKLKKLIPNELTKEILLKLKEDSRSLAQFMQSESRGEKTHQERDFILKNTRTLQTQESEETQKLKDLSQKMSELKLKIEAELKGEKATSLIEVLSNSVKASSEEWNKGEKELKTHELSLKEFQSKLYTLDEHLKDLDMQFTRELHSIKEEARIPLPPLSEELTTLITHLQNLSLDFTSSEALFVSLKELLEEQKDLLKEKTHTLKMNHARVSERLEHWEKLQDKILILDMKKEDLKKNILRIERLSEVLGKDELRSFVLSLVEENLIVQTNEELQRLCQGRYEIIHQARGKGITPDFYILDKYREGGRRKVSTLSGGETFMVSLAMALALAEMTRGQAEIDSLFIDEGFGTLDQESLEDVLDMLNQIQTRGLMVGIISHIKPLTNSLPVNLMLNKKQDGTSTMSLQYN